MEIKMKRFDREIKDFDKIVDVLDRCETLRVGMHWGEYPYVVPMSFGYDVQEGSIVVYFHGAWKGMKGELLAANGNVCIEGDIFHGYEMTKTGITTKYESIIGFGKAEKIEGEEKVKALQLMVKHCGNFDYDAASCPGLKYTAVYKVVLDSVTGKGNVE